MDTPRVGTTNLQGHFYKTEISQALKRKEGTCVDEREITVVIFSFAKPLSVVKSRHWPIESEGSIILLHKHAMTTRRDFGKEDFYQQQHQILHCSVTFLR